MAAARSGPAGSAPAGRYGADADARADRGLRVAAVVFGVLVAAGVGLYGYSTLGGDKVSAQVVAFEAQSDQVMQIHLEVHKGADSVALCTVRSVDEEHDEVGRKDVRIAGHGRQVDTVVTLRTTARGTTGELVGCKKADG